MQDCRVLTRTGAQDPFGFLFASVTREPSSMTCIYTVQIRPDFGNSVMPYYLSI
jgi:hypothetical protein